MPVDVSGMTDVFDELDDLQDEFGTPTEDWVVGTAVEYSIYLEFGTRHMDPKPFFRPVLAEARARGIDGFLEAHTSVEVETLSSIRQVVVATALAIENRVKEVITRKTLIDTGTLRASVIAVPVANASNLPDVDDFSGFDVDNPAPPDAGRALVSRDIEVAV